MKYQNLKMTLDFTSRCSFIYREIFSLRKNTLLKFFFISNLCQKFKILKKKKSGKMSGFGHFSSSFLRFDSIWKCFLYISGMFSFQRFLRILFLQDPRHIFTYSKLKIFLCPERLILPENPDVLQFFLQHWFTFSRCLTNVPDRDQHKKNPRIDTFPDFQKLLSPDQKKNLPERKFKQFFILIPFQSSFPCYLPKTSDKKIVIAVKFLYSFLTIYTKFGGEGRVVAPKIKPLFRI